MKSDDRKGATRVAQTASLLTVLLATTLFASACHIVGDAELLDRTWEKFFLSGSELLARGEYEAAHRQFEGAVESARASKSRNLRLGLSYDRLGESCHGKHSAAEAIANYRLAIKTYERLKEIGYGSKSDEDASLLSKEMVRSLNNLGKALAEQRKFKSAREAFAKVEPVCTAAHLNMATDKLVSTALIESMLGMGASYEATNRPELAVETYARALEVGKKIRAPLQQMDSIVENQERLLVSLGRRQSGRKGAIDKATSARIFDQSIISWLKSQNAGEAAYSRGDIDTACKNFRAALQAALPLGFADEHVLATRRWIFKCLRESKEWELARHEITACRSLISMEPAQKGFDELLSEINNVLKHFEDWKKLEKNLEIQIRVREKMRGRDHYLVGEAMGDLGMIYLRDKQYEKARTTLERAIKLVSSHEGLDSAKLRQLKEGCARATLKKG